LVIENPPKKVERILDLCGGNGWIGSELKKAFPEAVIISSDIDPPDFGEYPGIEYIEGDLFENVDGVFDIIISDPPYMTEESWIKAGSPEPKHAFTVPRIVDRIIQDYDKYLAPGGMIGIEVDDGVRYEGWENLEDRFIIKRK
jgi:ribosomal protein L3 glutamine methyltransferase